MVVHACKSALGRLRQKECMHLRPVWVVEQDPTPKNKELEMYFRGGMFAWHMQGPEFTF